MPDFARMIDEFQYTVIVMLAGLHWSLQKAVLMAGYTVKLLNAWLIDHAFVPLIAQTNSSLRVAVGYAFVIALLVLAVTYLLAAFIRLDVVHPRSALLWFVAGLLFYTVGPSFYQSMNDFRLTIAEAMYLSVLQGMQSQSEEAFGTLAQVTADDLGLAPLCDQFDVYLPGATGAGVIDGLDIALGYLRGHAQDVMGYPQPVYSPGCAAYLRNANPSTWTSEVGGSVVPMDWNAEGGYFDATLSPIQWDDLEANQRDRAVSLAGASQRRALTAWPLLLFGLAEQVVHLLITLSMGITFISFGVAILFAFFKRTESIAHSVVNQWIELIVQTTAMALIQALVIGFFLAGAATGSAPAIIGIGLICLVFILILLVSGVKAVWNSFNRLFQAMGQVSGQVFLSPGAMAGSVASAAVGGAALYAGTSASALAGASALYQGATPAQAAGLALGGSQMLTSAARTLAYLPGLRGTALGEAAEQFAEGAITRQVAGHIPVVGGVSGPLVGSMLLTNRDPAQAQVDEQGRLLSRPMLVPAVGDALQRWTVPMGTSNPNTPTPHPPAWVEDDEGNLFSTFTPTVPRRMGMFTPVASAAEASAEASADIDREHRAQQGEELEQHLSEQLQGRTTSADFTRLEQVAARLETSAEALTRAAQTQHLLGQLKVSGGGEVAGVLGDVVRLTQAERAAQGSQAAGGMDHLAVSAAMARVLGIQATNETQPAIMTDLSRFGLFTDTALRLGLSGGQTEQIVREVKSAPDGQLSDLTRTTLVEQVRVEQHLSHDEARDAVGQLEHTARLLPNTITAFGWMTLPTRKEPRDE